MIHFHIWNYNLSLYVYCVHYTLLELMLLCTLLELIRMLERPLTPKVLSYCSFFLAFIVFFLPSIILNFLFSSFFCP